MRRGVYLGGVHYAQSGPPPKVYLRVWYSLVHLPGIYLRVWYSLVHLPVYALGTMVGIPASLHCTLLYHPGYTSILPLMVCTSVVRLVMLRGRRRASGL